MTTNYDVDRTISHTRLPVGMVRRLSVAVILNNHRVTDSAGKVSVRPFSEAEKTQMSLLIKDAVGFDAKRGDALSLFNSPFADQKEKELEIPLWKQPESMALAKNALKYLVILGVALYLMLGIIRPALRNFNQALKAPAAPVADVLEQGREGGETLEGAGYGADGQTLSETSRHEAKLTKARAIAVQEPAIVASVLRDWMHGE